MGFARSYDPHELDLHPDKRRILATVEQAVLEIQEELGIAERASIEESVALEEVIAELREEIAEFDEGS